MNESWKVFQIIETGIIHSQYLAETWANFDTKGLPFWVKKYLSNKFEVVLINLNSNFHLDLLELKSIYEIISI